MVNQTRFHLFLSHVQLCVCVLVHCVSVLSVCAYERRLRDRMWLDWCPSSDESAILMCQQEWIMHSPPLPLLSSPPLVLSRSTLFSSQLPHLKTSSPPPPPLPLLPLCKRWHHFPHCFCRCLIVLWSTLLFTWAANSFKFYSLLCRSLEAWQETFSLFILLTICTENGCWCKQLIVQLWEESVQPLTWFDSYMSDWQDSLGEQGWLTRWLTKQRTNCLIRTCRKSGHHPLWSLQ